MLYPTMSLPLNSFSQVYNFRTTYEQSVKAPHGWWSIISLDWLKVGDNRAGSDPNGAILLPKRYEAHVATLHHGGDYVIITPTGNTPMFYEDEQITSSITITQDTKIHVGEGDDQTMMKIVSRSGRWGSRSYDPQEAARRAETEYIAWFEPSEQFRVPARFIPAEKGEVVPIVNIIGDAMEVPVAGRIETTLDGKPVTLTATRAGANGLFLNFTDATNRVTTYGGGRFMTLDKPDTEHFELDFNFAFHPPCAHSPYATCPMPPEGNHIPVEILAGERSEREE